jgi:hypothetical protein
LKTKNLERIVVVGADIGGPACEDQSTTGNLVRLPYLAVRMPAQKDVATLTDVIVDIRSIAVGMNLLRIEVLTGMVRYFRLRAAWDGKQYAELSNDDRVKWTSPPYFTRTSPSTSPVRTR